MASYKSNQIHGNHQIKSRNTVLYPLQPTQSNNNIERRIFETRFAVRQNQHNVKPTIPILYGIPQSTTSADTKNINFQKILQVPGYTNPTSPRTSREKQQIELKKQCQSQGNSPIRYDSKQNDKNMLQKIVNPQTTSSNQVPQREHNEHSIKTLIVPFQSAINKSKKTLVLDLDETLIHSQLNRPAQFDLNFKLYTSTVKEEFFVNFRPKVQQFLKTMASHYEIFVWTASIKEYADVIINQLDPTGTLISYRLYRESCRKKGDYYIKDLALLNRNMKDIIIIDNLSTCFNLHQENGIQIQDFTTNDADNELEKLSPFLQFMSTVYDVRDVFKWKIKFENQSHFEYKTMSNQNRIFISQSQHDQLKNENPKEVAPYFVEIKQNNSSNHCQLIQQPQQIDHYKQNDSDKKDDYIYRSRRSVSTSLENSKSNKKCEGNLKANNLEHSFGGSQTLFCTDEMNEEGYQYNPLFQEFTFSKLKIEDSRVVEEEITKTTERVIEKSNLSNKHERIPLRQVQTGAFKKDSNNSSPSFNKPISQQLQGYHHSLQPTVFKLFEQSNNVETTQPSNRNTPSFERNTENKENTQNNGQVLEKLQKNLKGLIQGQKNQLIKQNLSNNNSESSQRLSESSQNSTQHSATNITQSKSIQSSQFNDTMRISFQNKSQNINSSQQSSEYQADNKSTEDRMNSTGTFKFKENINITETQQIKRDDIQKVKKDINEFNIYQSHPMPRFLQLPSQKLEKPIVVQQKTEDQEKTFTFQPAQIQCQVQKQQQQLQNILNIENEKQRTSQQNKEVPQIKKDPSIQSITMELRRHTLDNIIPGQATKQAESQQLQNQQPKYPKIFEQNPQIQIPLIGSQISLSKYQPQNQVAQLKVEKPIQNANKQEIMIKSANTSFSQDQKINLNNTSLQQLQNNQQQIVPKRHYSQYVSSNQIQNNQQPNYHFIKQILNNNISANNRLSCSPVKDQNNKSFDQLGQINKNRQEFSTPIFVQNAQIFNVKQNNQVQTIEQHIGEQKTPSTASNSQNKNSESRDQSERENIIYLQQKVIPFEDYVIYGSKGTAVYPQKSYHPNAIQNVPSKTTTNNNNINNNNKIFTSFEKYIQRIN